jgi:hypothetical protein
MSHRRIDGGAIRRFLAAEQRYRDRTRWHARDSRAEAVAALEGFAWQHKGAARLPKVA